MNVDDIVQERIAAARRRTEENQRRRRELAEARRHGLKARHTQKIKNLAAREERQEVVASLRENGLSVRAISAATGVSDKTVMKDLRQVSESTTPVLGADGKTYTTTRPEPEPVHEPDLLAGDDWVQPDGPPSAA